jgi:RNA polymerase sigma factor (sigma-70 family)
MHWSGLAPVEDEVAGGEQPPPVTSTEFVDVAQRGDHQHARAVLRPTRLFGSESAAFAYLRTAVLRKSIDLIRGRRPSDDVLEQTIEDRGLLRFEEDQAFFARLQHLPQQQRAVLVLRYYLDLDDRRIAELLDITRATVRSNAMRGLDKLRAETRAVAEER